MKYFPPKLCKCNPILIFAGVIIFIGFYTMYPGDIIPFTMPKFARESNNGTKLTKKKAQKGENWLKFLDDIDLATQIVPEYDKFIYTDEAMNGGLGNQMYRFASLYSLGRFVNRTPVFVHNEIKMRSMFEEMENTFPEFYKRIYFLKLDVKEKAEQIKMDQGCCMFTEPYKLAATNGKSFAVSLLGTPNFENHRYFHHMREDIRALFACHANIVHKIDALQKQKFGDGTHKLCVHIRVGDFHGKNMGESSAYQVGPAIEYVRGTLSRITQNAKNVSLLIFGSDMEFLQNLQINNDGSIDAIHHIIELNLARGEEICLASRACDSFLITAPLSSFAFWMGYLMPDWVPIFSIRKKIGPEPWDSLIELPPDWITIEESWLNTLIVNTRNL